MNMNIYAIKDTKTQYKNVMILQNDAVALRTFKALADDPHSEIHTYADDMELWKLGTWDNITGQITGTAPEFMEKAINVMEIE